MDQTTRMFMNHSRILDRSKAVLLLWFILIVFFRSMPVSLDYLFTMLRIAWWTSAGKELTSWPSACAVFSLCSLDCLCSFPV